MVFPINKIYSAERRICPDFERIHKKRISNNSSGKFVPLNDLAISIRPLFPERNIDPEDFVCRNCYRRLVGKFQVRSDLAIEVDLIENEESGSEENIPECTTPNPENDELFLPESSVLSEEMNEEISSNHRNVSPLRAPWAVKEEFRHSYAERKRKQMVESFSETSASKLSKLYDVSLSAESCSQCDQWTLNFRSAMANCHSKSEKIRLLTILPEELTKQEIQARFSDVSIYMIDQARKLKLEEGIYQTPDPYNGHPMNKEEMRIALEYFLNDDLDCSRQSPNKSDVIKVNEDGKKVEKVKRFMTRSIGETFHIFRDNNPQIKVGKSKFYSLRPKWVLVHPLKEVCVCIYCGNFDLCIIGLKGILALNHSDIPALRKKVLALVMCAPSTEQCELDECKNCPGASGITIESIGLSHRDPSEEVTFAIWNKAELEKRTTTLAAFLEELADWSSKVSVHMLVKNIQREAIKREKERAKKGLKLILLHGDFAENWKVIMKNAIQNAYWVNQQVSIFTAVCYRGAEVRSFAIVSDDTKHDSAHALLAMKLILDHFKRSYNCDSVEEVTIVTDGAAAHFKNRYQFQEMIESSCDKNWFFSATGHGKGACDGVGGLVKHYATSHNLKKSELECIKNATDFVNHVREYTSAITLIHLPVEDLKNFRDLKKEAWQDVPAITGIQKCHLWKSVDNNKGEKYCYIARTAQHPLKKIRSANFHHLKDA